MLSIGDTIVAIATPPGRGGIGIIRLSGPRARAIGQALIEREAPLEPRQATFTRTRRAAEASLGDTVIATSFPAPHSYTGQDVLEISAHGSPVVLQALVRASIAQGARLAEPGEFTLRAFVGGKLNLVQAEAVADLVEAVTPLQARVAFDQLEGTLTGQIAEVDRELFDLIARLEASLDFPDEGYHFIEAKEIGRRTAAVVGRLERLLTEARRGRLIREGATVVVAGRTNVGKSSIFNMLVGSDRAIVTAVPGTTRDLVSERIDLEGIAVTLVDTAGARESLDLVEREGIARGARARRVADLVLLVLDDSEARTADDHRLIEETKGLARLIVSSKADCLAVEAALSGSIAVSARTGEGLDVLRSAIVRELTGSERSRDSAALSNVRHIALVEQARQHLAGALDTATRRQAPEEFVLVDLQAARGCLEEVVGTRTGEDVLRHIFERFCIGK